MRKILLATTILLMETNATKAQTVATFDSLSLPGSDTFYVNYDSLGKDVGFDEGFAHFPCVYDSAWGSTFWSSGFAYTNKTDSMNGTFTNQYSAITAKGYGGSSQYVVCWGVNNIIQLKGAAKGKQVKGFYITNSTYTYKTIRDGDAFSKKFGGVSGNDSDWYKLTIGGYLGGTLKNTKVDVYLADYRPANNAMDSILNYWKWVDLTSLGNVDSLDFELSSTDTGSFGMNTPAYFCMDNFTTNETASVNQLKTASAAKIYPNPALNELYIEVTDSKIHDIYISNLSGKVIAHREVKDKLTLVNTSSFAPGVYVLQLIGEGNVATTRFVKQ